MEGTREQIRGARPQALGEELRVPALALLLCGCATWSLPSLCLSVKLGESSSHSDFNISVMSKYFVILPDR